MKTQVVIVAILLLCPVLLFGQFLDNKGVKIAYTSSNISHSIFDDFSSSRSGFNAGLFVEFGKFKLLSFVTNIEYAQKGFIEEQVETGEDGPEPIKNVEANTRLDYLSIPLFLKVRYPDSKYEPYVILGPRFDHLFNKKNGVYKFTKVDFKSESANYFDKNIFGSSFGVGFNLPKFSRLNTFVEFRYNVDFSDSYSSIKTVTVKNRSYDFWLGFSL
jgi:hypothetical protein